MLTRTGLADCSPSCLEVAVLGNPRRSLKEASPSPQLGRLGRFCDSKVIQTVAQAKWDKAKLQIKELLDSYAKNEDPDISYKQLEVIHGFLCHLSMT
jgi:hypothetical protein